MFTPKHRNIYHGLFMDSSELKEMPAARSLIIALRDASAR
jgi:hypothetical protein